MNHTSTGMNGTAPHSMPPPVAAKPARGPKSGKMSPQDGALTALPPIHTDQAPARPRSAPKRGEASRAKIPRRPSIPADVADLISFAQAYPTHARDSSVADRGQKPAASGKAARGVRTPSGYKAHPEIGLPPSQTSESALQSSPSFAPLPQNASAFREAYGESFREAIESYRENVREDEPLDRVVPLPKKTRLNGVYAGSEEVEPGEPQHVAETAQVGETHEPVSSGDSLLGRLGASVRGACRRVAGTITAPFRGLGSAWAWYQGRRVLQSKTRRMRVAETISLGEKRFLAVVEVDDCQFLVGGGASSVAVLAQLTTSQSGRDLMNQQAAEAQV